MDHKQVMKVGFLELIGGHTASIRRARNREAERAMERASDFVSGLSCDAICERGKKETVNANSA
jgi:hypothetical protein